MSVCRFCGRRVWPWQKTLPVGGRSVHWHCYSVSMHTLHVMFTQYIEVTKLVRCKKLLMKCWNTGEWLKENWNETKLAIDEGTSLEDVLPYALSDNKTEVGFGRETGSTDGNGTIGLEESDEEEPENYPRLEDHKQWGSSK